MYRNVTCPKCGKVNQISNINKYIGKKIRLVCLNTACGKEILLDLTNEDSDTTMVVNQTNRNLGQAELVQMADGIKVKVFPIDREENIVGRISQSEPADIIIKDDPYLSRKHLCIKKIKQKNEAYEYMVFDLKARNKTKINNTSLKEGEKIFLKDGDVIVAGNTTLVFNIKKL